MKKQRWMDVMVLGDIKRKTVTMEKTSTMNGDEDVCGLSGKAIRPAMSASLPFRPLSRFAPTRNTALYFAVLRI